MSQPIWWSYFRAIAGTEDGQTIATAAGVTPPQVSRWKTGKNRPSADQVIKFARHYDRPPVEALASTGYLRYDELGMHVECSRLPTQDLDDRELLDEIAYRLKARVEIYERTLVQVLVAVGQLQSLAHAMVDGREEESVSDLNDHLGVLTHSIYELASSIVAEPSKLKKMIADTALQLRSQQIGHVRDARESDDLFSRITAWPFDYANVRRLELGIEYVHDDEIIRSRASKLVAPDWDVAYPSDDIAVETQQGDYDLAAPRDTGSPSQGRQLRDEQDRAAEDPDSP